MFIMELVSLTIDGTAVQVPQGSTVLEAAQAMDISIPTLCHFPGIETSGLCRICVVEVDGYDKLLPACVLKVKAGMIVKTYTPRIVKARRMSLEMLIAQHPMKCLTCYRNGKCQLQDLARRYGLQQARFARRETVLPVDDKSPAITHDPNMCILCGLCINACRTIQAVDVIDFAHRSYQRTVEPAFGQSLNEVECIACGQCIQLCPVNSLYETQELVAVQAALQNPETHVVAIVSPVTGVSLGEEFENAPGMDLNLQLAAILKQIGFDRVFNAGVGVDIVLLEEAYQLLTRVKTQKRLPMLSSSSPAWVKYIEHFYPEHLSLLSTCKSPVQALAALIKTYYAHQQHIDPERIFTVSITPCTAEKFERTRPEMIVKEMVAVDACLTTKETASLLQGMSADLLLSIAPQPYSPPFDEASGAGMLFGAAGGMLEGVMRTFYELFTERKLKSPEFQSMREPEGWKEIHLKVGQETLLMAIVDGTGNVKQMMEKLQEGHKQYHYIEIKGCPNGCARGGGQPLPCVPETIRARALALYELDARCTIRKAHENPCIKEIYEKFLKKPSGPESKKLLHTTFTQRERYL